MKKLLAIVFIMYLSPFLKAQDTTVYKNPKIFISGLGGLLSETSVLKNSLSECIGAAGALSFNHYAYIGAYGVSLVSNHKIDDLVMPHDFDSMYYFGKPLRTNFSHAGIWLGGVIFPKKTLQLIINARIGWGSIHLTEAENNSYIYNVNNRLEFTNDKIFVFTPEIGMGIRITSWLQCQIGIGYRFVSGVDFYRYTDYKFNAPQLGIGLYFGGFYNKNGDEEAPIEAKEE